MEPVLSTITVCGAAIPLKRAGKGPAMLMLHGSGGAPRFLPGMQKLAERFEVFVPQVPGFGGTALPDWLATMDDVANFYREFLAMFDLRQVHLVGLSLGGWAAAALAIHDASRLASLTLVDAPGIAPRDSAPVSEEQAVRDTFFDPKFADDAVARAFAPGNAATRESNRRLVEKLAGQHRYYDARLQAGLHHVRLPMHIIWGANDRILPPAFGEIWQQAITGARLTLIPRAGHLPIQEQPDAFATAVGDFCAKV